jgi:hypothetical protein
MLSMKSCTTVGALLLLAGCGETGKLRVDSQIAETSLAATSADGTTLVVGDGTLVIDSAALSVSEIEFEGGSEEDELEAELGSAHVPLALDGGPTTVAADDVDVGTYHTLGLELRSGGNSIAVTGTYAGAPFRFISGLSPELEFPLSPPVEVTADGEASVAVIFDLAAWFTDANGAVIDPNDSANHATIESRILSSMAAHAVIEQADDD